MAVPAGWRVAASIPVLFAQLRPLAGRGTDPRSWGTVAGPGHDSTSDHWPTTFPGWGRLIVTAGDFPKHGDLWPWEVLDAIRESRDPRVKYGIAEREMFSAYPARGYPAWTWRPYPHAATDPHDDHGHLSVVGDARADGTHRWAVTTTTDRSEEHQMRPVLMTRHGKQTVWVKVPGEPLRAVTGSGAIDIYVAMGATWVQPMPARAIVEACGPLAGLTTDATIDKIDTSG